MQIIIPMSGFGERFRRAGYQVPKPLIEVDGKPIIAHVIAMFPGETNFIFICNEEHLNNPSYKMREILNRFCPDGLIVSIAPHKLGPVYAVLEASKHINLSKPTIVNYCDFTCYWDWQYFKKWVKDINCSGAVPAYRGFHPHSLGTTNYAYIREKNNFILDIQEKKPYTNNRMQEYASSGTYYFSSGALMLEAFEMTIKNDINIGGEYYVSLAYKHLLTKKLAVSVYELQHFMQWGTPDDLEEYKRWSALFRDICQKPDTQAHVDAAIIPMAGLGQRFKNAGYKDTKPLIPVSGMPMAIQATNDLPKANHYVFVLRKDMPNADETQTLLLKNFSNALIEIIPNVTDGQACTAMIGLNKLLKAIHELKGPIIFGACDNGALYDTHRLNKLLHEDDTDVIIWGVRGHPNAARRPEMYGWIDCENSKIKNISVKMPLSNPKTDPIVLGTFIFKRAHDFKICVERMIERNARINGEFYLDTCINDAISLGLKCKLFEVNHYISWGTPDDLRTFEYWQSCFHKWEHHPYRLENDYHIPLDQQTNLSKKYSNIAPELSGAPV